MKKNKKIIISAVVVVALIAVLLCVYAVFKPKASEGTKSYTVNVVDDEGVTTTYTGKTDAEYLSELMDELVEDGLYITTINDVIAEYATNGAYWSIYVNGEYGQYGAQSQPVADGDEFSFVYEVYDAE